MNESQNISPTKWRTFFARVKASEAYQIFVARARKRRETGVLYVIAIGFMYMAIGMAVDMSYPILELEQMEKYTGTVVAAGHRGRTREGWLRIRMPDGKEMFYVGILKGPPGVGRLQQLLGKPVTVWSQRKLNLVAGYENETGQIQYGDELIEDYKIIRRNMEELKKTEHWWVIVPALIAVLPLLRIWWMNRRLESQD